MELLWIKDVKQDEWFWITAMYFKLQYSNICSLRFYPKSSTLSTNNLSNIECAAGLMPIDRIHSQGDRKLDERWNRWGLMSWFRLWTQWLTCWQSLVEGRCLSGHSHGTDHTMMGEKWSLPHCNLCHKTNITD